MSGIRDTILNADDRPEELVEVAEWGVTVLVRGMSAGEAVDFFAASTKQVRGETEVDRKKWGPGLLIACCFDPETKEPVFEAADIEALGGKSSAAVTLVAGVAARLSGLGGKDDEQETIADFD